MLKKINIFTFVLGILVSFNSLSASITKITWKDLDSVFAVDRGMGDRGNISNQRMSPLYIDSAQFGSDDVTSKVQYHAAYGKLYIPLADTRAKTINFTIADKKYSLSIKEKEKILSVVFKSIVTTDITYSDRYEIWIRDKNDPYLQKLNVINRGILYKYLEGGQNVMVFTRQGWQARPRSLGISKLQSNFGDRGIIPVDKVNFDSNVDGKFGSESCYVIFKITIDNRDLKYYVKF